ncbi:MAG: helix-turn-helix transcriptional regulator [Phycisphaeraceae bacterium]|nr:helix-turn-helix transcriptional regulator [Phycisphaeraceae bacterium]
MHSQTTIVLRTTQFEAGIFRSIGRNPGELRHDVTRTHLIAIPRSVSAITQAGRGERITTPVRAVFYNRGCHYTARSVCSLRETTLFIRVPTAVLADAIRPHDPRVDARGEQPLTFTDGPMSDATYLALTRIALASPRAHDADRVLRGAVRELIDGAYAERARRAPSRHGVNDDDYVRWAQELISLSIGENIGLAEIARRVGVSSSHLCQAFRRRLGMTTQEFRACLRLRFAMQALAGTTRPVGRIEPIAANLGYPDPAQFALEFRRRFGVPAESMGSILRSGVLHPAGV